MNKKKFNRKVMSIVVFIVIFLIILTIRAIYIIDLNNSFQETTNNPEDYERLGHVLYLFLGIPVIFFQIILSLIKAIVCGVIGVVIFNVPFWIKNYIDKINNIDLKSIEEIRKKSKENSRYNNSLFYFSVNI